MCSAGDLKFFQKEPEDKTFVALHQDSTIIG